MKKIIILGFLIGCSLVNAQEVVPGKLRYYNNQEVAKITNPNVNKDVKLHKYNNDTIAKTVGNSNVKLHKYDNETVAKAFGGTNNVKLHKYNNENVAKSVATSNVKLKKHPTQFNVAVVNKKKVNIEDNTPRPVINSSNLDFNGKNQNINK